MAIKTEKLWFTNQTGQKLAALLDLPGGSVRSCALFAHCFTCSKDIFAAREVARHLAGLGFAVLRFDFAGLGQSQGDFADTNFSSDVSDLVEAAKALEKRGLAPELLVGHSLGGAAAIMAAPKIPSIKALVSIAAPANPAHVMKHFDTVKPEIEAQGIAKVQIAGRPFTVKQQFLDDLAGSSLDEAQRAYKGALLVLHAPLDQVVGIDNAAQIFTRAQHPKSFISLDNADHLLSRRDDASYVAGLIATWAQRYLSFPKETVKKRPDEGVVRATERDPNGLTIDLYVGKEHHLISDEPLALGGANLGPTPYQLVSSGLASCTALTLRMYARRKKLPLEAVSVDVSHDKVHASDCEDCERPGAKIDLFHRSIRLEGELNAEQRKRLLEIADLCPVHKSLHATAKIETVLE